MWTNKQKATVKIYQRHCAMPDAEYRSGMHALTGASSSTARNLSDHQWDLVMAWLEGELARRVGDGECDIPHGINPWYWRNRLPRPGVVNSRQVKKAMALFEELRKLDPLATLPSDDPHAPLIRIADHRAYLAGMAAKASGETITETTLHKMSTNAASLLIEALKSRIKATIRRNRSENRKLAHA